MRFSLRCYLFVLVVYFAVGGLLLRAQAPWPPKAVPPAEILVENEDNLRFRTFLAEKYPALKARWAEWIRRADAFNFNFVGPKLAADSAAAAAATKEQAWLTTELDDYRDEARRFAQDIGKLEIDRTRSIALMIAKAGQMKLSKAKVDQARLTMEGLRLDGDVAATPAAIAAIWRTVNARNGDAALAAEAVAGDGPTLFSSGTQESYSDCTIFALASAMGRPYGLVAAEALQMVRDATWRGKADRDDPTGVLKREGLNGDEVTLLVAAFGQAKLVPSTAFVATLREKQPVLVGVKLAEGDSVYFHQVVLSRMFRHHGETWFEMIDSHLENPQRRYLSEKELFTVLMENGLSFRPDRLRTVTPLSF